jgi:hypothetical protein
MNVSKICTKCQTTREDNEFYKQPAYGGRKARKQSICKYCRCSSMKHKYENDYQYRLNQINSSSDWQKNNQDKWKDKDLRIRYGIRLIEYRQMLESQNKVCAICGGPETRKAISGKLCSLHVDHNHENGQIRGLLCHHCNTGIGSFKESIELMKKAISYIEKHNT